MKLFLAVALSLLHLGNSLIAFDCGAPATNITTLSLLEITECAIPIQQPETIHTRVQLLQRVEFKYIHVIQCRIEISRTITHCGMHSHTSEVKNGHEEFIKTISEESCRRIHETGNLELFNVIFNDIKPNSTNPRSVMFAGSIDNDGSCVGAVYSDPYGTWKNVIVLGKVSIAISDHLGQVRLDRNIVILKSGYHCKLTQGECIDPYSGYTFWNPIPRDQCKFNNYEVLYEGTADRIVSSAPNAPQNEIYSITSAEVTFALSVKRQTHVCGYKLIETEHPKLFIMDSANGDFFTKTRIQTMNMDIFAYVNSKLIYMTKYFANQITHLYNDVIKQECELEKRVLRHTLSFAAYAPAEFAYSYMNEPGYIAYVAGEVIRLAKCVPVNVNTRKTQECYQEIPVKRGNESLFITPRTHILTETAHEIECNSFLSPMYYLDNAWYQALPQLAPAITPEKIGPNAKSSWKFITPAHLADSGIYTSEDLDSLRTSIMFPVERTAVLHTLARGASGKTIVDQGITISRWIDENVIQQALEKTWGKVYSFFNTVGTFSATLLGAWVTVKIVKLLVDTIVHGYALHSVYGWSIWLIGAIWDSVTHLLVLLGKRKQENATRINRDVELGTISTNPMNPNPTQPEVTNSTKTDTTLPTEHTSTPIIPTEQTTTPTIPTVMTTTNGRILIPGTYPILRQI